MNGLGAVFKGITVKRDQQEADKYDDASKKFDTRYACKQGTLEIFVLSLYELLLIRFLDFSLRNKIIIN